MISRTLLSLLLVSAGIIHLVRPDLFNSAIPFPFKLAINYFAGLTEIILGLGLWHRSLRDLCAKLTALWFLLLTPIHLWVSFHKIPMFGIEHPVFLWGRTFLQFALYFWGLSLQDKGWIIAQRWSDVLFLHYEVNAQKLQKIVPFPLDLFEGKAVVSIVPFVMKRIRFPFLFPIPGLSRLIELNLRTYVRVNGRAGVYFFTLDSNHLPGVLIARSFFSLPYRWIKMIYSSKPLYQFESTTFKLKAKPGRAKKINDFDLWATERYALFTKKRDKTLTGVVEHAHWKLLELDVIELKDEFSKLLGEDLPLGRFLGGACCSEIDVRFRPFYPEPPLG